MMDYKAKIEALLHKAAAHGVTEHEADACMQMAADLMRKYQIEEAELRDTGDEGRISAQIETRSYPVSNKAQRGRDRVTAVSLAVNALGGRCVYVKSQRPTVPVVLTVVATTTTLDMLDMLIPSLLDQIEYHANRASRARQKRLRQQGIPSGTTSGKYRSSFTQGYGVGVRDKILEAEKQKTSTGADLVLVKDRQDVEEEFQTKYGHVKARKRRARVEPSAYMTGMKEGAKANLGSL